MRKELLPIAALGFMVAATPLHADELTMPDATSTSPAASLPGKGMPMAKVEKVYGAPSTKRPAVGGGSPSHPPITRWDYPGFSVFFEHDKVVHAVVPSTPPRIQNRDGLEPTDDAPLADDPAGDATEMVEEEVEEALDLPVAEPGEDPGLVEDREKALEAAGASEEVDAMPAEAVPVEAMPATDVYGGETYAEDGTDDGADMADESDEADAEPEAPAEAPAQTDLYDEPQPLE